MISNQIKDAEHVELCQQLREPSGRYTHTKTMQRRRLSALIWEEDGVFVSKCPEIEVSSAGGSPQDALANLKEAVELWIVNAKELQILPDYLPSILSENRFMSSIEIDI